MVPVAAAEPWGTGGDSLAVSACGFLSPCNGPKWPLQMVHILLLWGPC